jgi:hypothetical protein
VVIKPTQPDITIDEIAHILGEDYDIILTDCFKQGSAPKIEVHRKEVGSPLGDLSNLIAIATDEILKTKTRQFSLGDIRGLADFLEEDFIRPQSERISLHVNNVPISLSPFPKEIITNIVLALATVLKGVEEVRNLEIFLKKEPKQD